MIILYHGQFNLTSLQIVNRRPERILGDRAKYGHGLRLGDHAVMTRQVLPCRFISPAVGQIRRIQTVQMTPYYQMDGMNEADLAVSSLDEPEEQAGFDPNKKTLWFTTVLRLLLDNAKDVNEAITLLQSYNIDFISNHFIISDRSGDSVVIEFTRGQMKAVRSGKPWQVVTKKIIRIFAMVV